MRPREVLPLWLSIMSFMIMLYHKKITKEENTSCEKYLAPEILDLVHFATSLQREGEDFLQFPQINTTSWRNAQVD